MKSKNILATVVTVASFMLLVFCVVVFNIRGDVSPYVASSDDVFSWIIVESKTGTSLSEPEVSIIKPKTEYEKFMSKDTKKSISFLPEQPQMPAWSYSANTNMLKEYAQRNIETLYVPDSWKIYLYIKTKDVVSANGSVVLYVKNTKDGRNCWWWLKQWLSTKQWNEYLYNMDNIEVAWVNCGTKNRQEKLWWSEILIWWYVGTFDSNKIEEITIAY